MASTKLRKQDFCHVSATSRCLQRCSVSGTFPGQRDRGKGGGLELARAPEEIRIGAVIRDCETQLPAECFDRERNTCVIASACELKHVLKEAADAFYQALDRYTLADITSNRRALTRILLRPAA
jgi:Rrf2 family nitric oxide-sensitive transcriptional repressor